MRNLRNIGIAFFFALLAPLAVSAQSPARQSSSDVAGDTIVIEMLMRAERRAEALQSQLYEGQMRELVILAAIDDLDNRLQPDNIQRALAFVGSTRPMDELRDGLRVRIESAKERINVQLEILRKGLRQLESSLADAEAEIEMLRQRLGPQ
jgi:hypothetical protein